MGKTIDSENDRANWDDTQDIALANAVVEQILAGNITKNGYNKTAWANISNEFKAKTVCNYNIQQLRNHLNILKSRYRVAKGLRNNGSGFDWDSTTFVFTAGNDVWEEYLKAHPNAEWLRKSRFPVYDHMAFICDGKDDEGKFAKSNQQPNLKDNFSANIPKDTQERRNAKEPLVASQSFIQGYVHSPQEQNASRDSNKRKSTSTNSHHWEQETTGASDLFAAMLELADAHRFRAMYSRPVDNPFSLNKCINALEALDDIDEEEIFNAIELFKKSFAREVFMSLKPHRRLNWLRKELSSMSSSSHVSD